jgi:hypothetical protein
VRRSSQHQGALALLTSKRSYADRPLMSPNQSVISVSILAGFAAWPSNSLKWPQMMRKNLTGCHADCASISSKLLCREICML